MNLDASFLRRFLLSASMTVLVAVVIALISGCNVSSSSGRNSFESNSKGNLVKTNLPEKSFLLNQKSETCWTQPANEALWEIPTQALLRARLVQSDQLEVCIDE